LSFTVLIACVFEAFAFSLLAQIRPAPSVRTGTPSTGGYGASIVITGTNFTGATAVSFGGTSALSFTVDNDSQITAVVGCGTSGDIAITTPSGRGTSAVPFTYTPFAPAISNFSPSSGQVGTLITIQGRNIVCATSVIVGGARASFTVNRDGSLAVMVPSGASSGAISITSAGGTATSSTNFSVTQPVPSITSFLPNSGAAGTLVIIKGENFTGTSRVTVGGVSATFTMSQDGTTLNVAVPEGAQTGTIVVVTPNGTTTSRETFTVLPSAPVITSFAPTTGGANSSIIIQGRNFSNVTRVTIGGVSTTFVVNGSNSITVTVPSNAQSGVVTVTTAGGTASSSQTFTFTRTSIRDAAPAVFQARLFPQPSFSNAETTLEYSLPELADVRVDVVNVLGERVASYSLGKQQSGSQRFTLNTANMSSGAYFVRLSVNETTAMLPMQVVR
jgi:hypothetical protein